MSDIIVPQTINLLHPLVSWEWESYIKMAYSLRDIQAVCLHNNVYILGYRELICFDGDQKLPKKIPCPAANSTLTTYQGKLVLVGGHDLIDLQCTNKLWSLQDDDSWIEELPPMTTKRCGAAVLSIDHHLIVAGGEDKEAVEVIVEVFDGKRWSITYSPRVLLWKSKSVLHDGVWYVFGERDVVSASVEALIDNANGKVAEHDTRQNMWRKLEKLEELLPVSSIVIFRGHILILKHVFQAPRIYAMVDYWHTTLSWLHVVDLQQTATLMFVLPSDELVVAGGHRPELYKASFRVDSFQKGRLSIPAIMRLQYAVRVPLFLFISAQLAQFAHFLKMTVYRSPQSEEQGKTFIEMWLNRKSSTPATWQSLVEMLASVKVLASLSEKVKGFLTQKEKKFIDLSKEIEVFWANKCPKKRVGERAKNDGLERAEEEREEGEDSVSRLRKQLQGMKKTITMMAMKLHECQEEVQKVVAETDAALQKTEEIKAQLAEAHQREASTDVTGKKASAAKRRRTSSDGGIGAEKDKKIEEIGTQPQIHVAEGHHEDASAVTTDERNTTKTLIAPVAEGTTSVLCDRPTLPMLLDFPGSINIPERIGMKYLMFGTLLLKDDNGVRVQAIESKCKDDIMNINIQILREWILGNDIPCTWDDLIRILKKSRCSKLAADIEERL